MERRREQQPGPEDPEESPFGVEVAQRRPGHDPEHQQPGQVAGRHRPRQNGFDDGERPLVRAPVLGIGGQAAPERGPRLGIGKMKDEQHHRTRRRQTHPVPADERRQGHDGREFGQGGEGQRGPHRPGRPSRWCPARTGKAGLAADVGRSGAGGSRIGAGLLRRSVRGPGGARRQGEKDQDREQKDAEGLEVSAPRRLDHQQRRPGEEDEGPGHGAAGAAGHLPQQSAGRQVGEGPEHLEREHRPARKRARREYHLGEGRIDGGNGRIVDAGVPGCSNRFEFRRVRRVQVGVDPLQLYVTVPEVAVDVVGQKRNAGE